MIEKFLKAKPWQIFLLLIGIPVISQIFLIVLMLTRISTEPNSHQDYMLDIFQFFPLIMIISTALFFGWFWSMAIGLQKFIPPKVTMNVKKFKILFSFPVLYISLFMIYIGATFYGFAPIEFFTSDKIILIIMPLHLFSMFCIFYMLYFVAKTIKTVELQKEVTFGEYIGEFFLLWFYLVGIWIIQPKINILYKAKGTTANNA